MNRERKVDVEKIENIEEISEKITQKITEITDEAVKKANKLLNIYGMTAKMQIAIELK